MQAKPSRRTTQPPRLLGLKCRPEALGRGLKRSRYGGLHSRLPLVQTLNALLNQHFGHIADGA